MKGDFMKKNQNIYATTMCHKCQFAKNCAGRAGLYPGTERIDCVPAYTALSKREEEDWGYPKKGKKRRSRSKQKVKKKGKKNG